MTTGRHACYRGELAALESRLAYHLRCLREDATNQDMSALERLALVRDHARRIREFRAGSGSHEENRQIDGLKTPLRGSAPCTRFTEGAVHG